MVKWERNEIWCELATIVQKSKRLNIRLWDQTFHSFKTKGTKGPECTADSKR